LYSRNPAPGYLSYFEGADRLTDEFPRQYDLAILLDAGGPSQINRTLEKHQGRLAARPFVILDHHTTREPMPWTVTELVDDRFAATGELVAYLAEQYGWPINNDAANLLTPAILADTLGLTTKATTAGTVARVASLVRQGADLHGLNERRLAASALSPELLRLRAQLLLDAEWLLDDRLVVLTVSPEILKDYAKAYDPAALVFFDLQHVQGVQLVAVIKNYGTKIKLSMRANTPVADRIAEQFDGGGHPYAAAAAITGGDTMAVRAKVIELSKDLLPDAAIKHPHQ
jgi:phosphoesterase RecJ-like protein